MSFFFFFKQKTAYDLGLCIPAEPLFRSVVSLWEAFKKVISRRNIRRRITIPLTLSNLKLLRRSEERRVGKECKSWWGLDHYKKNESKHVRVNAIEIHSGKTKELQRLDTV